MEAGEEEVLAVATTLHPMVCPETCVKYVPGVITVVKMSKHVARWFEEGVLKRVDGAAPVVLAQKTGHGEDGTAEVPVQEPAQEPEKAVEKEPKKALGKV